MPAELMIFDDQMGAFRLPPTVRLLRVVILAALFTAAVLSGVPGGLRAAVAGTPQQRPADLADILKRCAAYCDRLSDATLDFVCLERIDEMVADLVIVMPSKNPDSAGFEDPGNLMAIAKSSDPGNKISSVRVKNKVRSQIVYDYQLVRDKQGHITETRTTVKENGRPVIEKNASLKSRVFKYTFIIMGPVTLLGRARQKSFDYTVIKEATFGKDRAVIIKATPKPGSSEGILSGKIWVRKSDAEVLRIEWEPESVGHYEMITDLAKQIGAEPRLTLATELAFEKNGVRFPSRYTISEMYVFPTGTPLVRSTTEVTLSDYKFFAVETGVVIR